MIFDLTQIGVIHPELVANTRGDKVLREITKEAMSALKFYKDSRGRMTMSDTIDALALFNLDLNVARGYLLSALWIQGGRKIYAPGMDIMKALIATGDLPVEGLPESFMGYILFPRDLIQDLTHDYYQGCYVWIGKWKDMPIPEDARAESKFPDDRHMVMMCGVSNGNRMFCAALDDLEAITNLGQIIDSQDSLESRGITPSIGCVDAHVDGLGKAIFKAALQVVIFLQGNVDLSEAKPMPKLADRVFLKKSNKGFVSKLSLPVTMVNWGWVFPEMPPNYGKAMWLVKGHLHTYWVGKGRSIKTVKFIEPRWAERDPEKLNNQPIEANTCTHNEQRPQNQLNTEGQSESSTT